MVRLLPIVALAACSNSGLGLNLESQGPAARVVPCADRVLAMEGERAHWGQTVRAERRACASVQHAVEGPSGALLDVTVRGFERSVRVEQVDWNGWVVSSQSGVMSGTTVAFYTPFAGEHLIRVIPEGSDDVEGAYELEVACAEGCDTPYSRYPMLLMHGMGAPIGGGGSPWSDVEDMLYEDGYQVWAPEVSPWHDSPTRSREWKTHIDDWQASGTFRKLHLVGHSMGGVDARYVASLLDEENVVASVTTIATPHRGTPIADIMSDVLDNRIASSLVEGVADWLAERRGVSTDQDIGALANQLSSDGMAEFNALVLDRTDIPYRSWAGVTCRWLDFSCRSALGQEVVGAPLLPTFLVMRAHGVPSDGAVDVESAQWGEFQGILAADHGDSIGGNDGSTPSFYWEDFFRNEAQRIVDLERGLESSVEPQSYDLDVLLDI